jgi:hypothetical protein
LVALPTDAPGAFAALSFPFNTAGADLTPIACGYKHPGRHHPSCSQQTPGDANVLPALNVLAKQSVRRMSTALLTANVLLTLTNF